MLTRCDTRSRVISVPVVTYRRVLAVLGALTALAALLLAPAAGARPVAPDTDGRPNILVVMTDDQALADVQKMPNVRKLLAAKGTSFSNAVDPFPLCAPARA